MNELEERWRDLGEFIREQRRVGQLSLRKLSEMAGISNPYLSQIERGLRKPSAEILQQIARALQISSETLYVQAGILEPRDGDHDLVHEIRRDPYIDEDQKKTLVHIYQSFRASSPDRVDRAGNDAAPRDDDERAEADDPDTDDADAVEVVAPGHEEQADDAPRRPRIDLATSASVDE